GRRRGGRGRGGAARVGRGRRPRVARRRPAPTDAARPLLDDATLSPQRDDRGTGESQRPANKLTGLSHGAKPRKRLEMVRRTVTRGCVESQRSPPLGPRTHSSPDRLPSFVVSWPRRFFVEWGAAFAALR